MPHDERMLKGAFKTFASGKGPMSNAPAQYRRGGAPSMSGSQTPYINKTYDMKGGMATNSPSQMSP